MTTNQTKSDRHFVEAVRKWRLGYSAPVACKSNKVIHQFPDMTDGWEPLYLHPPLVERK